MRLMAYKYVAGMWYRIYQRSGIDEYGYFIEQECIEWR